MQNTQVRFLDWEDPLEKGKAAHSSISGLENSIDCVSPWGRKESSATFTFTSCSKSPLLYPHSKEYIIEYTFKCSYVSFSQYFPVNQPPQLSIYIFKQRKFQVCQMQKN